MGGGDRAAPQPDPATRAAFGLPPAGADDDYGGPQQGTFDPGYADQGAARTTDQTYGTTAKNYGPDGNLQEGLTLGDYSGLTQDGWEQPEYHVVQPGDTLWDISGDRKSVV